MESMCDSFVKGPWSFVYAFSLEVQESGYIALDISLVFTFDHACMCLLLKWSCLKVSSKQISSPEPKALEVSFYYGIDLVSVHVFVCPQLNISETSRPIVFKFI